MTMNIANCDVESACKAILNHFFDTYPDDKMRGRALKALRFLMASDDRLEGNPAGWAGGIVYALANRERIACGLPGLLNKDTEEFFGASMATIRNRAARVNAVLEI